MTAPAHLHANLHIRTTDSPCLCRNTSSMCPSVAYHNDKLMVESALTALLESLGDRVFQHQGGLLLGVYGALEGSGAAIALDGVSGVPPRMQELLVGLRAVMPLSAKREICRFLSVDCRRFAHKSLTENQVLFPGTTHGGSGDAQSMLVVTKAQVPRGRAGPLTDAIFQLFTRYPGLTSKVEFSFTDEVGTGNGPTQEVYAELCRLYKENTALWYCRGGDGNNGEEEKGEYFACPSQLQTFRKEFFVLGAACARGFADDYLVEMDLLPAVWGLVRFGATALAASSSQSPEGWRVDLLMALLATLDETLHRSYQTILNASEEELEAMCLESESGEPLTSRSAAAAFVQARVEEHFRHTLENILYFMLGFSSCLDLNTFWFLSNTELSQLFGAAEDDDDDDDDGKKKLFTEEEFRSMVEEAHGYEAGSPIVAQLISIVSNSFSRREQRYFIEFLTGVPRLPVNGIRGLSRKITVVKKDMEGTKEETLPSCSTCFLYLKLPPYSSAEIMRKRLLLAVMEGRRNFSLS